MESTLTDIWNAFWPYIVSAGAVPTVGGVATAILAFVRRPKSSKDVDQTYLEDKTLLSPPLTRPAYSDRMAYVLAELSDLAYYRFEGPNDFINDAIEKVKGIDPGDDSNIREFLDGFSADMMSGRRLSLNAFSGILQRSGFSLLGTINVKETQGFICKREAAGEAPYLVLAFRGTEKKISDWLTDADCFATVEGESKIHTGFLDAFTKHKDSEGRTARMVVEEILSGADAKTDGQPLPLFITGHSLGGALALLATKLVAPDVTGACYTFGAPRLANYEYFRLVKTPVYRVVNSSDVVPRVPPGAAMFVLRGLFEGLARLTAIAGPPVSAFLTRVEEFMGKLSGYRHHGDLRYLTDVAEGRFHTVRLLSNPPAIDRLVWMWRRVGRHILIPVKSHGMEIYRRKLRSIANARDTS